jgi:transglutaminase-like putative cysteine protease
MSIVAPSPLKPPAPADRRHRRVLESLILDMLAFQAWGIELAAGRTQEARAGAASLLDAAVDAGLDYAKDSDGERLFDPAEVDQFLGWLGATGVDRRWRERKTITNAGVVAHARAAHAAFGGDGAARFRLQFRRTFDLGRLERGARARLRLPLPLRSLYHEDFTFTPVVPADLDARCVVSEGRLEMRLAVPAHPVIILGVDLDLVARPPAPRGEPAPERDLRLYLRPAEGVIRVTPRIAELARRIAGSLSPELAVAAFADHIAATLRGGFVRYDEIPVDAPFDAALEYGVIDCKLIAALLISLCRARGIPARLVNGYFLYPLAPTNHSWAEIWIDGIGWAPFDGFSRERYLPDAPSNPEWWTHFARRRGDYRMAVERLPRDFTGPMSIRFPQAWQILQARGGRGAELTFIDIASGRLIYRDHLEVERIG